MGIKARLSRLEKDILNHKKGDLPEKQFEIETSPRVLAAIARIKAAQAGGEVLAISMEGMEKYEFSAKDQGPIEVEVGRGMAAVIERIEAVITNEKNLRDLP